MKTKVLMIIAVVLMATVTLGTQFWVGETPSQGIYGEVHSWKVDSPVYDWWIPVVDPNGNYPNNQIGVKLTDIAGDFEITDVNYILSKPYNEDPNRYVEVRVQAVLPRYGLYSYRLDANDSRGNIGTGIMTVEYLDKEPPIFGGGCTKGR